MLEYKSANHPPSPMALQSVAIIEGNEAISSGTAPPTMVIADRLMTSILLVYGCSRIVYSVQDNTPKKTRTDPSRVTSPLAGLALPTITSATPSTESPIPTSVIRLTRSIPRARATSAMNAGAAPTISAAFPARVRATPWTKNS